MDQTHMSASFQCRACGGRAQEPVLDLGLQPLANNLLRPQDPAAAEPRFPLRVFVCHGCWLLQITDVVPPAKLFSEYPYFSSFSDAVVKHARESAQRHVREHSLGPQSQVVEIASNDGYLLQHFKAVGVPCLGIEPAANVARVARDRGIETVTEFFSTSLARRLVSGKRRADLIIGNNVFAHAPDINDFVDGIRCLLKPAGRFILEFPYGVEMVEKTEFDTIYHEHVYYFTLTPLIPLFRRHELDIFHVETLPLHGGSLRVFGGPAGAHPTQSSVAQLLNVEQQKGVNSRGFYESLAEQVSELRDELCRQLREFKAAGKSIAAYGASAKGSTLLNFSGLGRETLDFVADRSPHKQGRLTPGTHLPIVPPDQLLQRRPDYTLLLSWNFADEILEQQRAYREAGGKFILPIPRVSVV
jgi:SAM-dependent methyltransferase